MARHRIGGWVTVGGIGILMALSSGCQVHYAGMTLPSGRYLEHPPQYFPDDPDFPLTRELAYQEATSTQVRPAGVVVPGAALPPPVPAVPRVPVAPVAPGGGAPGSGAAPAPIPNPAPPGP